MLIADQKQIKVIKSHIALLTVVALAALSLLAQISLSVYLAITYRICIILLMLIVSIIIAYKYSNPYLSSVLLVVASMPLALIPAFHTSYISVISGSEMAFPDERSLEFLLTSNLFFDVHVESYPLSYILIKQILIIFTNTNSITLQTMRIISISYYMFIKVFSLAIALIAFSKSRSKSRNYWVSTIGLPILLPPYALILNDKVLGDILLILFIVFYLFKRRENILKSDYVTYFILVLAAGLSSSIPVIVYIILIPILLIYSLILKYMKTLNFIITLLLSTILIITYKSIIIFSYAKHYVQSLIDVALMIFTKDLFQPKEYISFSYIEESRKDYILEELDKTILLICISTWFTLFVIISTITIIKNVRILIKRTTLRSGLDQNDFLKIGLSIVAVLFSITAIVAQLSWCYNVPISNVNEIMLKYSSMLFPFTIITDLIHSKKLENRRFFVYLLAFSLILVSSAPLLAMRYYTFYDLYADEPLRRSHSVFSYHTTMYILKFMENNNSIIYIPRWPTFHNHMFRMLSLRGFSAYIGEFTFNINYDNVFTIDKAIIMQKVSETSYQLVLVKLIS